MHHWQTVGAQPRWFPAACVSGGSNCTSVWCAWTFCIYILMEQLRWRHQVNSHRSHLYMRCRWNNAEAAAGLSCALGLSCSPFSHVVFAAGVIGIHSESSKLEYELLIYRGYWAWSCRKPIIAPVRRQIDSFSLQPRWYRSPFSFIMV